MRHVFNAFVIAIVVIALMAIGYEMCDATHTAKQHAPSRGTYVPEDIEVTDTIDGKAAVSFTHKDGMFYVLYFNEDKPVEQGDTNG